MFQDTLWRMVVTIVTLNNLKLARPHNSDLLDIPTTFSWHLDSASWAPMQSQVEAKVPREQKQMNVGIWWNIQVSRCYTQKSGNKGHSQSSQPIRLCFCCFSRKVYMWIKERTRNKSVLKTGFGLLPELCLYLCCSPKPVKNQRLWPCYGLSSSFLMCCTDTDQTEVQLLCAQSSRGWVDSE